MEGIKASAVAAEVPADDSMVIGGSILPRYASGQEGKLRTSAVVIEGKEKLCMVSCDVLMLQRDILDEVCREVERTYSIPFDNILICATHTHHAPTTVTIHGYERDEVFCSRLRDAILSAVDKAIERPAEAEMYFWLGEESSVGQNSRLLLGDGTIYWAGPKDDAVRPTGPFDPELPVIWFRRSDGGTEALLFNHSTHNIGTRKLGVRSPGFYGLAAQELEEELGGAVLFLPGAFGSTHNLTLPADEMVYRIKKAVKEALSHAEPKPVSRIASVKREMEYKVRDFDEEKEDEAASYYCRKRLEDPEPVIEVFRSMRRELAPHQGETRRTWLQVLLVGDIAFVGVPGEFFTKLGLLIKRRSPFRYTYIVGLANDYIGYIPDREAFGLGGYQVWTGFHSFVAEGTGEAIVEEALSLLSELYSGRG